MSPLLAKLYLSFAFAQLRILMSKYDNIMNIKNLNSRYDLQLLYSFVSHKQRNISKSLSVFNIDFNLTIYEMMLEKKYNKL